MYIRKTVRRYKDQTYVNFLLVESVLTDKGPRQKVICSLGDLSPRPREQWLALARKLQDALTGQLALPGMADEDPELQQLKHLLPVQNAPRGDVDTATSSSPDDLVSVHIDRVTYESPRPAGHIHVGREFWKRLGLDDIFKSLGFSPYLVSLTCAMTLNRLIHPAAEYAMPDWIRSTAMADILGVDFSRLPDDPLYRNLDRLHPHRAAIESALAEREQSLFNLGNTILLYDLTSTYFEGKAALIPKAKRGYSRDHRPDCKQVVVGLVIGREGFPRAHEIFEGNTQDRQTLATMLELLEKRVGLARRLDDCRRPRDGLPGEHRGAAPPQVALRRGRRTERTRPPARRIRDGRRVRRSGPATLPPQSRSEEVVSAGQGSSLRQRSS